MMISKREINYEAEILYHLWRNKKRLPNKYRDPRAMLTSLEACIFWRFLEIRESEISGGYGRMTI